MENEKTNQENAKTNEEKKKIDFLKLFPKKVKFDNLKIKQKFAFTRVGKTKIG